jgi:hypothetical protein
LACILIVSEEKLRVLLKRIIALEGDKVFDFNKLILTTPAQHKEAYL